MALMRWLVLLAALALAALAVLRLEAARAGLDRSALPGDGAPATVWQDRGAEAAPVVVIAHGFAGSRQLMEGFAIAAARAGYVAVAFDFAGHGRNPVPMSGDVTRVEGTTRVLMDELAAVADRALALPRADGRVALVGHSMASDIVVRQAIRDPRVGAVVAVSMFSAAVTANAPGNLLIIPGAWEGFLSQAALDALHLADPAADWGQTVGDPVLRTARRAVQAPGVEHVGVLYSATTLRETVRWLDAAFGRASAGVVPQRGGWVALLLAAIVAAAWPLAGLMRAWRQDALPARLTPARLTPARLAGLLLAAGTAVPLTLAAFDTRFLPVLVADYLALHFGLYGLLLLLGARALGGWRPRRPDAADGAVAIAVAAFGIAVFGLALDRYVASFWPQTGRGLILAAMAAGAVPFMIADQVLTEGGRAPFWRALAVRGTALAALGLAVALDFERLFFLVIILPVILLFFLIFGTAGGWAGRATLRPAAVGTGLGLMLGWALAATFPLFAS
ncbi:MAG: alpha/beta hydrolase [Gemmobacter sp.]